MFDKMGMGPTIALLLPTQWHVLPAHRGYKRLLKPWAGAAPSPSQCREGILGLQEASREEQVEPIVLMTGQRLRGDGLTLHLQVLVSPEP